MLGFIGKFGSSKGMVKMPNLSGLTVAQALSAIETAGLKFSGSSTETTSDASLSDKIKSQSPATNTLLEYDSPVSFIYNSYSAPQYSPTVSYGDCGVYAGANITSSYSCSNYGQNNIDTETTVLPRRRDVFFDGVFAYEEECSPSVVTQTYYSTARCGYVAPAKTCTAGCGSYSAFGSCNNGTRTRTRTCTRTDCSTYTQTDSETCCTARCGAFGGWQSSASGIQERYRTCIRSDCTTYTDSEVRCTVRTTTSCGAWSRTKPIMRTCTTTTINSDCSTSRSSYTERL